MIFNERALWYEYCVAWLLAPIWLAGLVFFATRRIVTGTDEERLERTKEGRKA